MLKKVLVIIIVMVVVMGVFTGCGKPQIVHEETDNGTESYKLQIVEETEVTDTFAGMIDYSYTEKTVKELFEIEL